MANYAIVIPAYNEQATISGVVEKCRAYGVVYVCDDCSADKTAEFAEEAGAVVVRASANLGYAGALTLGFSAALRAGATRIISIDADDQHPVELIPEVLTMLSRYSVVHCPRRSLERPAEKIFSILSRTLTGINDPVSGMRGYSRNLLETAGGEFTEALAGSDMLLWAVKNNYSIAQLPISTLPRQDESRYGALLRGNAKILRSAINYVGAAIASKYRS